MSFIFKLVNGKTVIRRVAGEIPPVENHRPVATNTSYALADETLTVSAPGLVALCTDEDGDPLTVELVQDVYGGTLTLNSNGSFTYSRGSWIGYVDFFTYRAYDGELYSLPATVTIPVTAGVNPVVANADSYDDVDSGVLYTVAAPGVLSNDTSDDPITAVLYSDVSNGTLSLNANGGFTYTSDALYSGSDSFTYRAYDGVSYSDPATVTLVVNVATATIIDAEWIAARSAPYVLDTAGGYYYLATDVTTGGSAFVFGEEDIVLDLNGYTVTYCHDAQPEVPNGGFEDGTGRVVPHWDLDNAPSAAIATNDKYLWGDQLLKFTDLTSAEYILSDTVYLPAGQEYVAVATCKMVDGPTYTIDIIDAYTSAVLATDTERNERAFSVVASYETATDCWVKVKVTCTPDAGKTRTFYLDNVAIYRAYDWGIVCTPHWRDLPLQLTDLAEPISLATGSCTIRNGYIVQATEGYESHAFYGLESSDLLIDGVDVTVIGNNCAAVRAQSANTHLKDNMFRFSVDRITNRMHKGAATYTSDGVILIEGNEYFNVPGAGISYDSCTGSIVRNNTLHMNSIVSNGYGIGNFAVKDFKIYGNTILAETRGRGMMFDGERTEEVLKTDDGEIYNNYVEAREDPNQEYDEDHMDAMALRIRGYSDRAVRNLDFHDNDFIAYSDVGTVKGAVACRISVFENSLGTSTGLLFRDNLFKAIVETTDTSYWASAIEVSWVVEGSLPIFQDNTFESNDISLSIGTADGMHCYSAKFIGNTLHKSSEGAARSYRPMLFGYYTGVISDTYIYDPIFTGGATDVVAWSGSGSKEVSFGWSVTMDVEDESDAPIVDATTTITDAALNVVHTGTTDAAGQDADIELVTEVRTPSSTTVQGPHTFAAAKAGYVTEDDEVLIESAQTVSLTLAAE